jgi:CubicO group peptidase (beta-lactamase class C family)
MTRSVLALLLAGALGGAQAPPLRWAPVQSATFQDATALLERYVAEQKIAGAVAAVAHKGKVVYLKAVGVQDLESRAAMTERSLFRIYSMTKPVTAVGAMMLHEEGRFNLDDPVSKYLPEFKQVTVADTDGTTRAAARAITVQDLLLHTSGLSHRTSDLYRREQVRSRAIPLPKFIENIVRVPLMEDPATRYRYSEGTTVVGRLVEIWSGTPLDVFFEERIFKPLKMNDTMFWVGPDARARFATVYAPAPAFAKASAGKPSLMPVEIEQEVPFTQKPALLEGAVGLVSTVPDFMRFSQMLLNKGELDGVRVLKAATVERITANGLSDAVQKVRGGAMGWGLANVNVNLQTGEYGWDGSAGTIFWVDPSRQRIAILMTQSAPANPDQIRQRFKTIIDQIPSGD